jgi:hypothetical protein
MILLIYRLFVNDEYRAFGVGMAVHTRNRSFLMSNQHRVGKMGGVEAASGGARDRNPTNWGRTDQNRVPLMKRTALPSNTALLPGDQLL